MSNVLSLLRNAIRFKMHGDVGSKVLKNDYGITIARDKRNVESRQAYDCLAALATIGDVALAKICIDMIYRDLYKY